MYNENLYFISALNRYYSHSNGYLTYLKLDQYCPQLFLRVVTNMPSASLLHSPLDFLPFERKSYFKNQNYDSYLI